MKRSLKWFKNRIWEELSRFEDGKFVQSVTCTTENIDNLYNSQHNKEIYGSIFTYETYKPEHEEA